MDFLVNVLANIVASLALVIIARLWQWMTVA